MVLLVAEAVHHVVSGRAEIAGAAMDAAAGLTAPPELEVLQTPRSGRTVASTVVFCLPRVSDPPVAVDTSPTKIADPSVAAWLEQQVGAASTAAWEWQIRREDNSTATVPLAALGLEPCDTATLSKDALHQLVLASVPNGVEVLPDAAGEGSHAKVRQIINFLGSRPAVPADLVTDGSQPSDSAVATELRQRYGRLYQAATLLAQQLGAVAMDANATEAQKQTALQNARRWGIVPLQEAESALDEQVQNALEILADRLNAAPDPTTIGDLSVNEVATAIAELATPEGRYSVLGRVGFSALPTAFIPDTRPAPNGLNPIDEEWLSVVSAVRPAVARLAVRRRYGRLTSQKKSWCRWTRSEKPIPLFSLRDES